MGYPTDMFVRPNPLLDRLQCIICSDVLKEAVLLDCKHRFCRQCILQSLNMNQRCPMCRAPTRAADLKDDVTAQDLINDAPVRCENNILGCPWEGPLSNLNDHTKHCDYLQVPCPNSARGCRDVNIMRKDVPEHLKMCPYRDERCQYCNNVVQHKDMETHQRHHCMEFIISCLNGCGAKVKRKEMEQHNRFECPIAQFDCQFAPHGCTTKVRRENEQQHLESCRDYHMQLMCSSVAKLMARTQRLEEENRLLRGMLEKERVEQFAFKEIRKLMRTVPNGKQMVNDRFVAFNREWFLRLYPNGIGNDHKNHLSLYLELVDGVKRPRTMTYTITILNQLDPSRSAQCGPFTKLFGDNSNPSWGSSKLLTHEKFNDDPGYSLNDQLLVTVKLENPLLC